MPLQMEMHHPWYPGGPEHIQTVTERSANPLFISFMEHRDAMWPFLTSLSLWDAIKKMHAHTLTNSNET